jgi:hypothetical protein
MKLLKDFLNNLFFVSTAPTDLDLLQLTMNRMQKAESDARYLTSELKDKVIIDMFYKILFNLSLDFRHNVLLFSKRKFTFMKKH